MAEAFRGCELYSLLRSVLTELRGVLPLRDGESYHACREDVVASLLGGSGT